MGFQRITAEDDFPRLHAPAVVCIPLFGAHDLFVRCLSSVLRHTAPDVPILIADDASPDPASEAWVRELDASGALRHDILWLRQPENVGFVDNCNTAFATTRPSDIVLLNSDCEVADGWLEGLRLAAHSDDLVATATALTNNGTIVSIPYRNRPTTNLPQDILLDDAAARVRTASAHLRPRIPTAIGHCVYLRRSALDLVGTFDTAFRPAYGEEVDFSQRCIRMGMHHVVADDVLVLHHGRASLGDERAKSPIQDRHEAALRARYPFYERAIQDIEEDEYGPLGRAIAIASQALRGASVTIDGRCLTESMTGTQVHTLELISALARTRAVRLRVITPSDLGAVAKHTMEQLDGVELVPAAAFEPGHDQHRVDDIVHRPYQVSGADDLRLLMELGRRVVITHQDLIAYHNPSYFSGARDWTRYRRLTREALALADMVVFFSHHAERDALQEDLVSPDRSRVVHIGVNHTFEAFGGASPEPPQHADRLRDHPYLLVLGTDFRHKNRLFAIRLFAALRERHGWEGRLVLAGPGASHGSSLGDEEAWLSQHPDVAAHVVRFPALGTPAKDWLVANAAAVVYPSTFEGFGLLPFEAAQAGVPCLFAHVTSLRETLDEQSARLVPWDPEASADRCIEVLRDPSTAERLVHDVLTRAADLSWDKTATRVVEMYDEVLRLPARAARILDEERLTADARYWDLRSRIGPTGLALVDPVNPLLDEPQQRTVAALAHRPATRGPFLAVLGLLHRVAGRGAAPERPVDDEDETDETEASPKAAGRS